MRAQMQPVPITSGMPRTEADVTDLVEDLGYKPDTLVRVGIERFNIFKEGELAAGSTVKEYLTVQQEGKRNKRINLK